MKKLLFLMLFLTLMIPSISKAETKEWSIKDWSVRFEGERVFYVTHGSAVWGHEFGFFKTPGYCGSDTIWITFSFVNDEVLKFKGKDAVFRLKVDDTSFKIGLNMLTADKLTETTKVMEFTNSDAGDDLIALLNKGKKLTLGIIEPKDLVKYLDIKVDEYGLNGFIASRLKAKEMCEAITLK